MATQRAAKRPAPHRRAPRDLLRGRDYGEPILVAPEQVGAKGDGWVEPFLRANDGAFRRLELSVAVRPGREQRVELTPSSRIGAVALVSGATQRSVAGLLIEPRFAWASLGAVYRRIGFSVPPTVGGGLLVPGSARHVPPWILAAPVLSRIEQLLARAQRAFIEVAQERETPRGRIDWSRWARQNVPAGRWTTFPCAYPEPALDPLLAANIRWTAGRLRHDLEQAEELEVARELLSRIELVEGIVGAGPSTRPEWRRGAREASVLLEAHEAMGWVAEERGLGGARALDGLSWDVAINEVWESWVRRFVSDLAPRLGLRSAGDTSREVHLRWAGAAGSMRKLKPDAAMLSSERTVWFDAKYKPHLAEVQRRGWYGAGEKIQTAHRSDLHQALAYAACGATQFVDSVLVYPSLGDEGRSTLTTAEVASGSRRVRVVMGALPFGFKGPGHREQTLREWHDVLRESG